MLARLLVRMKHRDDSEFTVYTFTIIHDKREKPEVDA